MPSLLKRILFEVAGHPNERTLTLSSASNDGHFISLRPLVKPSTEAEKKFPFEWAFAGTNANIKITPKSEGVAAQDFNFWFDANVYLNVPNTHRGEVNTTWTTWESGCIQETGKVFPFGKDKEGVSFMELWQPVDANRDELIITNDANSKGKSIVFKVDNAEYEGLVIVVGKWTQGFLSKKNGNSIEGLNFLRLLERESGKVEALVDYGKDAQKFPRDFANLKKGSSVDVNGLTWEVIEYTV
ncbi:hypothetical protein NCAS_0D03120 [Naumovozyma castellii]|uniref:Protein HRI1 n=1 Tax=Naumovozyma castellii TaxID=27288 RepID=G0VEA2_NAUCA|nr:hypothetical protein NCAS_0D03120 [Naumovozyma castellii CBS 4309]CCC69893.1 hypothetical protein NCAS_0D03120 [Naumovozyma castellii CBS 4309]